jgi:hypothetical protein
MKKDSHQIHNDLLDVIRGYSKLILFKNTYYFKHFSLADSLEVESFMKSDIDSSVRSGIKKRSELLEKAIKIGAWSEKEEEKTKSLEWTIKRSTAALNKITDLKQREMFNSQIEDQRKELKSMSEKRSGLLKYSAESLAESKRINRLIEYSLYKDCDFKTPISKEDRLFAAPALFKRYSELGDRDNILMYAFHGGFLDIFATQRNNPIALFGCILSELTIFQRSLLIVTNSLLNKLRNVKIPDEISDDPIKIFNYEEKEESEGKVSHGVDDLKMKSKARGGKLKAEDFLS